MVLFPLAVVWLAVVLIWVLRNSRNDAPEERSWKRWPSSPRRPPGRDRGRRSLRGRRRETAGRR